MDVARGGDGERISEAADQDEAVRVQSAIRLFGPVRGAVAVAHRLQHDVDAAIVAAIVDRPGVPAGVGSAAIVDLAGQAGKAELVAALRPQVPYHASDQGVALAVGLAGAVALLVVILDDIVGIPVRGARRIAAAAVGTAIAREEGELPFDRTGAADVFHAEVVLVFEAGIEGDRLVEVIRGERQETEGIAVQADVQFALVVEAHAAPGMAQEMLPVVALPLGVVIVAVLGRADHPAVIVVDVQARRVEADKTAAALVVPALVAIIEADRAADRQRRLRRFLRARDFRGALLGMRMAGREDRDAGQGGAQAGRRLRFHARGKCRHWRIEVLRGNGVVQIHVGFLSDDRRPTAGVGPAVAQWTRNPGPTAY